MLQATGAPAYGFNNDLTTMSVQNGPGTGFTAADVSGALLGPSDQCTFHTITRTSRCLGTASELNGGIDTTLKGTLRVAQNQPGFLGELLIITGPLTADDNPVLARYFSDKWYYNY